MTSGDFAVTREYLGFVLQCLNGLSLSEAKKDQALNKLQFDVAVNIVFIIKEVFANFGKWRFATVEDKERIGKFFKVEDSTKNLFIIFWKETLFS